MTRLRVSVGLSEPMIRALTILAQRNGVPVATQATMCLRAALARTIEAEERKRGTEITNIDLAEGMMTDDAS